MCCSGLAHFRPLLGLRRYGTASNLRAFFVIFVTSWLTLVITILGCYG
jgi:hypothetical protein